MVGLGIGKAITVFTPFLLKAAVDGVAPSTIGKVGIVGTVAVSATLPVLAITGYALSRFAAQVANELRDWLFARVSFRLQRALLVQVFGHLFDLTLDFHLNRKAGAISRLLERGFRSLQFVFHFMTFNIVPTILEVALVTLILALTFPPAFALITLGTVVLYVTYSILLTEHRTVFRKSMNELDSEANSRAVDALINYETVKYFNNEPAEMSRYDNSLARYERVSLRAQGLLGVLNAGQALIIGVGLLGVMLLAGQGVVAGTMTIGDFVLVNTFLLQLYLPLNFLGFVYREIKQGLVDIEALFDVLDQQGETALANDIATTPLTELVSLNTGIEFKDVSFTYPNGTEVLKKVSLSIPAGKSVALVGESGSGKSTIARLLFGYYRATGGEITIDGIHVDNVSLASRRRALGVVSQDPVLFHESIRYNLLYADPNATEEVLWHALELAYAAEFVRRLPQGMETVVGERGLKLSGGEKQRIALARVFLKRPLLFIFDEATSSLDSGTEAEIQTALREVSRGATTLSIAHRLSTVVDADEIIVLRRGEVIERGTHDELLATGGEYYGMWKLQEPTDSDQK